MFLNTVWCVYCVLDLHSCWSVYMYTQSWSSWSAPGATVTGWYLRTTHTDQVGIQYL